MKEPREALREDPSTEADTGLGALLSKVVAETREVAAAEIDVQKAKVSARLAHYKSAAIFFGAAATLGFAALIALLVGLELTLTPLVGAALATAIVVLVTLLVAGVLAAVGKSRMKASATVGRRP